MYHPSHSNLPLNEGVAYIRKNINPEQPMKNKSEILEGSEVISVAKGDKFLMPHNTFKTREYLAEVGKRLGITKDGSHEKWLTEGVECEVLVPHTGWRKGKVKIRVEFVPDESEAVEEIRRGITEEMRRKMMKNR